MGNNFYVYGIFRPGEDLPFYIGKGSSTSRRAFRTTRKYGCKGNPYKLNIINKIIFNGGTPVTKLLFENLSESEAFEKEKELIKFYGRKDNGGILANLSDGGEGFSNRIVTEETRAKMSITRKGRVHSEETKKEMSELQRGEKNTMYGRSGRLSPNSKPLVAEGIQFESVEEARKHLKKDKKTIRDKVNSDNFPNYYWLVKDIV
ncbi:MAG: NUMOD3 domain-containing DNA-binding protein [Magnetococcus sp. YQC-3]